MAAAYYNNTDRERRESTTAKKTGCYAVTPREHKARLLFWSAHKILVTKHRICITKISCFLRAENAPLP